MAKNIAASSPLSFWGCAEGLVAYTWSLGSELTVLPIDSLTQSLVFANEPFVI